MAIATSASDLRSGVTQRLLSACARQVRIVRRYPLATALVLASFARVLWVGYRMHEMLHAVGYLTAVWVSVLAVDCVITDDRRQELPIRRAAWYESLVIVGSLLAGMRPWLAEIRPKTIPDSLQITLRSLWICSWIC